MSDIAFQAEKSSGLCVLVRKPTGSPQRDTSAQRQFRLPVRVAKQRKTYALAAIQRCALVAVPPPPANGPWDLR